MLERAKLNLRLYEQQRNSMIITSIIENIIQTYMSPRVNEPQKDVSLNDISLDDHILDQISQESSF